MRVGSGLDHELVEARRSVEQDLGFFPELAGSVSGLGEIVLGNASLWCCTELTTKANIDAAGAELTKA